MKITVFWDVTPCDSCRNRLFGGTRASIIRVTRIGELGLLAVASNGRTLNTLMMEALRSSETSVIKEPHGVTCQKTAFFIATAVKTSNLNRLASVAET
jgi:hypothetical protein